MWGLYMKNITKAAVWTSFVCGVGLTVAHMFYFTFGKHTLTIGGLAVHSPINAGAIVMILDIILVPLVSLFTRKPDSAHVDEVFSCLDNAAEKTPETV